jgi:hypothetical protein
VDVAERERQRRERDRAARWRPEGGHGTAVTWVELRLRVEQFAIGPVERPAGQGVDGGRVVQAGRVGDAPDLRHPVHDPGHPRQMLADANAGDRRWDRLELAPHFGGGVWLQVKRVEVARAAVEEDQDARPDRRPVGPRRGRGLGSPKAPEGQEPGPDPEQASPGDDRGGVDHPDLRLGQTASQTRPPKSPQR